jgi:hypothetical protein
MMAAVWAQLAATIFLGMVGLWVAYNYRSQIRLKLAERQVDSYVSLWRLTAVATPSRTTPLDRSERQGLYKAMSEWYFDEGHGILVPVETRSIFLAYQSNLICPVADVVPETLAAELGALPDADAERRRGCTSMRHATLLRNKLKNDLTLHANFVLYYNELRSDELEFLRRCGLPPEQKPWRLRESRASGLARPMPCVCGLCPS